MILFPIIPIVFSGRHESDKIKVVTTIFPLMEFAQEVGGERVEVSMLLPPGADIHSWRPKPSDILNLSQSDLFILIGKGLEPWAEEILDSVHNPDIKILTVSNDLDLIRIRESKGKNIQEKDQTEQTVYDPDHDHDHFQYDPHVWLDFKIDLNIIDKIVDTYGKIDSEGISYFKENGNEYKNRLIKLDENYRRSLKQCSRRTLIVGGHAAFGYIARNYGLEQIALYGLNPDTSPTIRQLVSIVETARKHNTRVIYFETNVSDRLARVIAEEIGAETLVLNPGANLTKAQLNSGVTFFNLMERNLENLVYGLKDE